MINCVGSASRLAKYPPPPKSPSAVVGMEVKVDHRRRWRLKDRYVGHVRGKLPVVVRAPAGLGTSVVCRAIDVVENADTAAVETAGARKTLPERIRALIVDANRGWGFTTATKNTARSSGWSGMTFWLLASRKSESAVSGSGRTACRHFRGVEHCCSGC